MARSAPFAITSETHADLADWINERCVFVEGTGCFEYQFCRKEGDYGRIGPNKFTEKYGSGLVHRLAYLAANGSLPPPKHVVRHTCDNPKCCNPVHLVVGTQMANMQDMVKRGRQARGETFAGSKLTEADVRFIRSSNLTHRALADRFGVNRATISYAKSGKSWSHIS